MTERQPEASAARGRLRLPPDERAAFTYVAERMGVPSPSPVSPGAGASSTDAAGGIPRGRVVRSASFVQKAGYDRAVARAEAAEARLAAFEAHRPAILDALGMAAADTVYSSRAGRFTAALEALDGSEEATRDG